jgi:hypothetical protein
MAQTTDPASQSPTTTTSPEDQLTDLPGFSQPPPPRTDPLDPAATTTPAASPWDDSPGGDGWDDADDLEEEGPRPGSGATTAGGSSRASTDWRDLLPITGALVAMSSMLVRWLRTRRRQLPPGVWEADEDDAAAIAAPLARIAARRAPIGGEGSADVVDGLTLMVGTTGYALKNLEREAALEAAGWAPDVEPGPDAA